MRTVFAALTSALCIIVFASSGFNVVAQQTLESSGPSKMNIAALNLKNSAGVAAGESELISDRLRGDLFNTGRVNVMERDQMQEVLKEQGFQASGACTDEACLVQMGQLLGVQALVTGSIGKVGSMFMVNVRMIDVKTAKIVKVVSVDVRGEIEDVVGKLKDIAEQLVSAAPEAKKPARTLNEKKEEPGITEKIGAVAGKIKDAAVSVVGSSPEEKKAAAETKVEEEKQNKPVEEDAVTLRNKNRSGIRLSMNMYFGKFADAEHSDYFNAIGTKTGQYTVDLDTISSLRKVSSSSLFNPTLLFSIKTGPFLVIDLGFGIGTQSVKYQRDSYYLDTTRTWSDDLTLFSFNSGLNFVKRWYPFKLNVGIFLDATYLNFAETYTRVENNYAYTLTDTTWYYHGFNASFGLRVGGEFLLGNHFGIGTDLFLRRSHFETTYRSESDYNAANQYIGETQYSRFVDFPVFGMGIGFNFYY